METKDLNTLPVDADNNHIPTPAEKAHDDQVAQLAKADAVGELEANAEHDKPLTSPNAEVGEASVFGIAPGAIVTSNSGNGTELKVESISDGKAHCEWFDKGDSQSKSGDFDLNSLTLVKSAEEAAPQAVVVPPSEHHDGYSADLTNESQIQSDTGKEGSGEYPAQSADKAGLPESVSSV